MIFILFNFISKLFSDTLKKEGKWSTTLLTMGTAWFLCIITYLLDFIKNGFKLNETAFGIMVVVALGSKVANSFSNKIEGKEDTTNTTSDGKN